MIENISELERGELLAMLRDIYNEIEARRMADLVEIKELLAICEV